jgi:16S rRNA processing protein RimM
VTEGKQDLVPSLPPGSGEAAAPSEPVFLAVGRVLGAHALRGEISVEIHTDYPERFATHRQLYLGFADRAPATYVPYRLQGHRFHKGNVLLKFVGIDDRTRAEGFRGQWVWIPISEAVGLEEGEVYVHQMIGLRVVTVDGEELGKIVEILETGANLVYVVRGAGGQILLPDIGEVVVRIDLEAQQVTVRLLEGLR